MIEIIWIWKPQYTDRGKKTLMLICKCLLCWVVKEFRKVRVLSGQTQSCWCSRLSKVKRWDSYWALVVISEAPRTRDIKKMRQLYVLCLCWNKTIVPIDRWRHQKNCGCWIIKQN